MRKIKIFLTTLAIAGVLFATSSCVDDSESASVTDLRGAKSAQLKAQAELAKAQAEAAKTLADAEYLKAENDEIRANGEKAIADARAEAIKAKTDIEKAKAAELLKQTIAEVAQKVAEAEGKTQKYNLRLAADILKLELQLKIAQVTANLALKDSLAIVVDKYSGLVDELKTAKEDLTTASVALLKEELTLLAYKDDTVKLIENYKLSLNANIRQTEKKIERLTKAIAEYQKVLENPNSSIVPLIDANELALQKAKDTLPVLYKAKVLADTVRSQAYAVYKADSLLRKDYLAVTKGSYASVEYFALYDNDASQDITSLTPTITYSGTRPSSNPDVPVTFRHRGPANSSGIYYWSGFYAPLERNIYSKYDGTTYSWYWEYVSIPNEYLSKEDLISRYPLGQLKEDTAKYAKTIRDARTRLKALPALVTAAGQNRDTKEAALDTAESNYHAALTAFEASAKAQADTLNVNNKRKDWDGFEFEAGGTIGDNADLIVSDTAGSAAGQYKEAEKVYANLLSEEKNLLDDISFYEYAYNQSVVDLNAYDAILAILSTGPLVDLNDKVAASRADYQAKKKLYEEADGLYGDWSNKTQFLYDEIVRLTGFEVSGLFTDTTDNKTAYIEATKDFILGEIEAYTIDKNIAEITLADYKAKLDAAALYADNGTTKTIEEVIRGYEDNIANYKAKIKEAEATIGAVEAQLDIVKRTIDALLALVNETE